MDFIPIILRVNFIVFVFKITCEFKGREGSPLSTFDQIFDILAIKPCMYLEGTWGADYEKFGLFSVGGL